jgi:glycerol-3-phosphate dehydrogenase (NAD(P)+)
MATDSTKARSAATRYRHVAVIGAGAWGTALAAVAAEAGAKVSLWRASPT